MRPLRFGKKQKVQSFTTTITDREDLAEIRKISHMLNPNEEVFVVARQSRLKPGGSAFTPDIVFGTDRRIIIKDPMLLGLRENVVDIPYDMISSVRVDKGVFSSSVIFKAPGIINSGRMGKIDKVMEGIGDAKGLAKEDGMIAAIPKNKAEKLVEIIRNGMDRNREVLYPQLEQPQQQQSTISVADELMKLANLKDKGIITEDEFQQMKQDLIKKSI